MDAGKYTKLKARGAVTLIKIPGDKVLCYVLRYDPETGDQVSPESTIISREQLLKMQEGLKVSMESMEAFIADVDIVLAENKV